MTASLGFNVQPKDGADYLELLRSAVAEIDTVDKLPEYRDPRLTWATEENTRTYTKPEPSENPLNAWSHRVSKSIQITDQIS